MSNDIKATWEENLGEEKEFWHSLASKTHEKKPEWIENFHARAQSDGPFPKNLDELLPNDQTKVSVLDVGAGPMTQLGSQHDWRDINITAVDPLADYYNELLDEYGIQSKRVSTISGEAEKLSEQFDESTFDLVYSRNALDHSYDPCTGILEMLKVCKPGASCWIVGSVNEGKKNNYQGLHQWNFEPTADGKDLKIWNQQTSISLRAKLSGAAKIDSEGATANWFRCCITKSHRNSSE